MINGTKKTMQTSSFASKNIKRALGLGAAIIVLSAASPAWADCTTPDSPEGGLNYVPASDKYQLCDGTNWVDMLSSNNANVALSGISAALATNTIANGAYAQVWNWDTLTTETALTLGSTSITSGALLEISSSATAMTGTMFNAELTGSDAGNTGTVVRTAVSGTSSTAVPLMVTNLGAGDSFRVNDQTGDADTTPFLINNEGRVGIRIEDLYANLNVRHNIEVLSVGGISPVPTGADYDARNVATFRYFNHQCNSGCEGSNGTYQRYMDITANTVDGTGSSIRFFAKPVGSTMTEQMRINGKGLIGMGTDDPKTRLHVAGSVILGDGSETCSGGETDFQGAIRYNATSDAIEFCKDNDTSDDSWEALVSSGGGVALSDITAAGATNTIANANYAQVWNWDTLTTETALTLGSTSATSGTLLNVNSSATAMTGTMVNAELTGNDAGNTGTVVRAAVTGTSSTAVPLMVTNAGNGVALRINDDGTDSDSTPFVVGATGAVGIGTPTPFNNAALTLSGDAVVQTPSAGLNALKGLVGFDQGDWFYLSLYDRDDDLGTTDDRDSILVWGDNNTDDFRFMHRNNIGPVETELMRLTGDGLIGMGITDPKTKLHVAGSVILGDGSETCSGGETDFQGAIRYNATSDAIEYCKDNDTSDDSWEALASAGGSSAINDLTDAYTDYTTDHNFIIGRDAATALTSGAQYNTFVGESTGATSGNSTSGTDYNVAIGHNSLDALTSGADNVSVGYNSLTNNTVGARNVSIGTDALFYASAISNNVAIGYDSMRYANSTTSPTTTGHVAIGHNALRGSSTASNNTSVSNTAVGTSSLLATTSGSYNVAIGNSAISGNSVGSYNVAIGNLALRSNSGGNHSVAIGYGAMQYANSQTSSFQAGNTAVGYYAYQGSSTAANNTGVDNVAVGKSAGRYMTSGSNNVLLGMSSGSTITTGSGNILIGYGVETTSAIADSELNIGDTIYGDLASTLVGIGTNDPKTALHVAGSVILGDGSETCSGGETDFQGAIRYNATTDAIEYCKDNDTSDDSWEALSTSGASSLWTDNTETISRENFYILNTGETTDTAGLSANGGGADGRLLIFDPDKMALHGGEINGGNDAFDAANIGVNSFAWGWNAQASGGSSIALGPATNSTNTYTVAIGDQAQATGDRAIALGGLASAQSSISIGGVASGDYSRAMGRYALAESTGTVALGYGVRAQGDYSVAISAGNNYPSGNVAPIVSGNNSMGIFLGVNDGITMSDTETLGVYGGKILIDDDASSAASKGCIAYDSSTSKLQFAHDCISYTDMGSASSVALTDLTDAFTDYSTDHNLIIGRASAAALTSGAQYNTFVGEDAGATSGNSTSTTDANTALGYHSLSSLTTGGFNTAVGFNAMDSATIATSNIAIGYQTLANNVAKSGNVAIGYETMRYFTSEGTQANTYNTAVGLSALRGSSTPTDNTGTFNTALGSYSSYATESGSYNTSLGYGTAYDNVDSDYNTAVGYNSLYTNVSKSRNTAIGAFALRYSDDDTTPANSDNTAVGYAALQGSVTPGNNTGVSNTAVGGNALTRTRAGSYNTAIGRTAMFNNELGSSNVAIGINSMFSAVAVSSNVAIGQNALYNTSDAASEVYTYNVAIGSEALYGSTTAANNTGTYNIAIGRQSLHDNSVGVQNVVLGSQAMYTSSGANKNIAIGHDAMRYANSTSTPTDTFNVALGYRALYGSTTPADNDGTENTAIGSQTIYENTSGSQNVALGGKVMFTNSAGSKSTAVGYEAMRYANSTSTPTDTHNTALGYRALRGSATASANTGTNNTAIGSNTLSAITTGSNNVAVGVDAGNILTTGSSNILIGYNVDAPADSTTGLLNIGNVFYGDMITGEYTLAGTASLKVPVGTTGQRPTTPTDGMIRYNTSTPGFEVRESSSWVAMGSALSDERLKQDINTLDAHDIMERLAKVETYSYRMKADENQTLQYGVIAQQVDDIFPELVNGREDDDKNMMSVRYNGFIAPLIEASKELYAENKALKAEIEAIKAEQGATRESLDELTKQVSLLNKMAGDSVGKASYGQYMMILIGLLLGMGLMAGAHRLRKA